MAVLDIRKGTPLGVRTPRPINARRCHSKKRRVVSPARSFTGMTIGVGAQAIVQKLAASVNEEARQLALAVRTRREAGTYRQGVDAQIATEEREACCDRSHARSGRFAAHGCLAWKDGTAASSQAARVSSASLRLRLSLSVALLVENRHVGVERVSGSASSRPRALSPLSEFPETLLPDFRVIFPRPYRRFVL